MYTSFQSIKTLGEKTGKFLKSSDILRSCSLASKCVLLPFQNNFFFFYESVTTFS